MKSTKTLPLLLATYAFGLASSHAALLLSESFNYDTGVALNSQGSTGNGLNDSWSTGAVTSHPNNATNTTWTTASGLSMNGVYSSGSSAAFTQTIDGRGPLFTTRALTTTISGANGTVYGSFLFSAPHLAGTVNNAQFGILLGGPTETDGPTKNGQNQDIPGSATSYYYAPDEYGTQRPHLKVEGDAGGTTGGLAITEGVTYLYLFEFNNATSTTTAWILNQSQFDNFKGNLTAAALNSAAMNTEAATGVVYRNTKTNSTTPAGDITHIRMVGYSRPDAGPGALYEAHFDELHLSDTSLIEAVTAVPEASTTALASMFAVATLLRRRRSVV